MTPKRVPLDRHTYLLLKLWDEKNPAYIFNNMQLNGKIEFEALVQLINDKWMRFFRLRSTLHYKAGYYFEEIPSFHPRSNMKQVILNDVIPTTETLISYTMDKFYDANLLNPKLPLWCIELVQFKTISVIFFICHHCLLDGVTIFEMTKVLSSVPSNLSSDYHPPIQSENVCTYYPMNPLLWWKMQRPILKQIYDKYFSNKLQFMIPKNGLKCRSSLCMSHLSAKIIIAKRKYMMQKDLWIRHSMGIFLLNILSEALVYFAMNTLGIKKVQIPNEMSITVPINLRPYYKNWKTETIFGNVVSAYWVRIPLDIDLSFNERLKRIKEQHDKSMNMNEPMFVNNVMQFESYLPGALYRSFVRWGGQYFPVYLSGVKLYDMPQIKILGKTVTKSWAFLPNPPGVPLSVAYNCTNEQLTLTVNIDEAVAGENGGKLFANAMKHVLDKYDCLENFVHVSKL